MSIRGSLAELKFGFIGRGLAAALALAAGATAVQAADLGTSFTYQGRLQQSGQPYNGSANLQFKLFDSAVGGNQLGVTLIHNGVFISDGLITRELDFITDVFVGNAAWLEINVNGITLSPRQKVTAAPYAQSLRPGTTVSGLGPAVILTAENQLQSGIAVGLRAETHSSDGHAINGVATHQSGSNIGVFGSTGSSSGTAVYGRATAASGSARGVFGQADSPTGYAGYFLGPRNYFSGNIGIGQTIPLWPIHVTGPQAVARLDTFENLNGSVVELRSNVPNPLNLGAVNFVNIVGQTPGQIAYTGDDQMTFRVGGAERMRISTSGAVCMGGTTIFQVPLYVNSSASGVFMVDRSGNGNLINFIQNSNGTIIGNISVSNGVVSYNAFTGSHYAHLDSHESPNLGTLVRMTGNNRRQSQDLHSEVIYGVEPSTCANDRACLGAYLGPAGDVDDTVTSPHLVMAVGNGDMWVTDSAGGDIRPGDHLISSDVPGCAMKDDPQRFFVGHIVARAAEAVDWSAIEADAGGIKRARISVLFENFMRHSDASPLAAIIEQRTEEINDLRARVTSLEAIHERLSRLEAAAMPGDRPIEQRTVQTSQGAQQ